MADRMTQLKAFLEADPNDPFCLYGLAMEHAKLGQHRQAVACFDRAIQADPNYAYAYFHKAKSQEAAGDPAGARATLHAGLEAAKALGDGKAMSEIGALLDELVPAPDEEFEIDEREEKPT